MTFRAGGLMSGMDTNSIIEQLVALERIPIQKLQDRQQTLGKQKNLIGDISAALSDLHAQMQSLDSAGKILAYTASSSDENVLTAKASGDAIAGTHTVHVLQLAGGEQDRSSAFAAENTAVRAGTLTLTTPGQDPVDITINDGDTLGDVAYAINTSGARVSAAVINTGSEYYLTLYSQDSGYVIGGQADDAITIQENYTGSSGQDLALSQTIQAKNAQIEFDGLAVERRDNTISDLVSGLTLALLDDSGQPTVTVGIDADSQGLQDNLQSFVDAYNKVMNLVEAQFEYEEGQPVGVLFGDSTLRNLMLDLQTTATSVAGGSGDSFSTLGQIGVSTDSNGKLSIDSSDLADAMASDFKGIASLFTTSGSGLCDQIEQLTDRYTDPIDGFLKMRTDGIDQRYDTLDDQINQMEDRVSAYEEHLIQQFTQLETIMGQLEQQQGYLDALKNVK